MSLDENSLPKKGVKKSKDIMIWKPSKTVEVGSSHDA